MKRGGEPLSSAICPYQKIRQDLKHNGYASISVIPPLVADYYANQVWDWMAGFGTGIKKDDSSTWTAENWPFQRHGLIQHFNVGHSRFVWEIRALESIMEVFARLWECDRNDLLVSFDAINVARPKRLFKSPAANRKPEPGWEHLDQTTESSDLLYYQGALSLTETDGGLRFYSGSYEHHAEFIRKQKKGTVKPGWYKLNKADRNWYLSKPGVSEEFVQSQPGLLTLWDSRTVHCGVLPSASSKPRICVYVCYIPRNHFLLLKNVSTSKKIQRMQTDNMIQKRIETFEARRMTTHKPMPVKKFAKTFQYWGHHELLGKFQDQPTITDSELTPVMRRLIGYDN